MDGLGGWYLPGMSRMDGDRWGRVDDVVVVFPVAKHRPWVETVSVDGLVGWYLPGMSHNAWRETGRVNGVVECYLSRMSHRGWGAGRQERLMLWRDGIFPE